MEIKGLQWRQEGKQGVDHPLGAYGDSHAEDNEVCYPSNSSSQCGKGIDAGNIQPMSRSKHQVLLLLPHQELYDPYKWTLRGTNQLRGAK